MGRELREPFSDLGRIEMILHGHRISRLRRRHKTCVGPPAALGGQWSRLLSCSGLERDFRAELPPSRKRLSGCLTKVSLRQVALDQLEIGMVKQVVELKPDLQVESLG